MTWSHRRAGDPARLVASADKIRADLGGRRQPRPGRHGDERLGGMASQPAGLTSMRLSGMRMWGIGSAWSLSFCLVLGAVLGFVLGYVTDAGPDDFFLAEGRFVAGTGEFAAVLGVGLGLIVSFPAGVLAAAIFAWLVSRRDVESLPPMPRLRWWAVAIAASVQLVAYLWFSWSTEAFDSPGDWERFWR